jgi:hypothetical protein
MGNPAATTTEFVDAWRRNGGNVHRVAEEIGVTVRNAFARRARLEARGYVLPASQPGPPETMRRVAYPQRQSLYIEDGTAVVFGDRHWWPGDGITHAEAALLALLHRLDPDVLIANGDVYDGAASSRHPPLGQEQRPMVVDELAAVTVGMRRIADHAKRARKLRTVGNHDRRFDYKLAMSAGEYVGVAGTRLADHLPDWPESWSIHINEDVRGGHTVVKHKLRQGVTAGRNNAMISGVHIVTSHTHRLDVTPVEDYNGRRYAVQCGALADPRSAPFEYAEDHPDMGRAGFAVLTWRSGILQPPELVECDDAGVCWFRGEPVTIKPRVRVRAETREAA